MNITCATVARKPREITASFFNKLAHFLPAGRQAFANFFNLIDRLYGTGLDPSGFTTRYADLHPAVPPPYNPYRASFVEVKRDRAVLRGAVADLDPVPHNNPLPAEKLRINFAGCQGRGKDEYNQDGGGDFPEFLPCPPQKKRRHRDDPEEDENRR